MQATAPDPVEAEYMKEDKKSPEEAESAARPTYETPAIEEIVTAEEMEREVHYAGVGSGNMQ